MRRRLATLSLLAWAGLALGRRGFWRARPRLEKTMPDPPSHHPAVAAIVPARDEEAVLGRSLPTLLAQRAPGPFSVIVVDDRSADGTGEAARRLGARVIEGSDTPPGWAGKVWAVAQGVEAAGPEPEYLLLTDADIAHPPDGVARLVARAEADGLDVVSVMARLDTRSPAGRLLIPAFVYFFALLYPFAEVARPGSRTAAAAGGCVLVRRRALERAGGLETIRGALIDDVALARAVKDAGGRLWLGLSEDVVSVREYPRLRDVWEMVARSAYVQLDHSPTLLAGTLAGLALLFLAPLAGGRRGLAAWAVMSATYAPTVRFYRLPPAWALTLPPAGLLYAGMTLDSAIRHWRGRGSTWKGREYGGRGRDPSSGVPPVARRRLTR